MLEEGCCSQFLVLLKIGCVVEWMALIVLLIKLHDGVLECLLLLCEYLPRGRESYGRSWRSGRDLGLERLRNQFP